MVPSRTRWCPGGMRPSRSRWVSASTSIGRFVSPTSTATAKPSGLRARRVDLARLRIEVVEVRYDAGKFGSGYTDRPKSDASIRPVPMAPPVVEAVCRRLEGCPPDGLVFCGPGGSLGVPRGVRSNLSVGNYRRVYGQVVARAGLDDLDAHGPHDLRHTFATWLEDAGVPARVIDELMGHRGGRAGARSGGGHGSLIGASY